MRKYRPPLAANEWKFLPGSLRETPALAPARAPAQPFGPGGVEAHYSAFLDDARRARLGMNTQPHPQLSSASWLGEPTSQASMLADKGSYLSRPSADLDSPERVTGSAAAAAGGDVDVASVLRELELQVLAAEVNDYPPPSPYQPGGGLPAGARADELRGAAAAAELAAGGSLAAGGARDEETAVEEEEGSHFAEHAPEPTIIWRAAAPVRVATNIPAELLPRVPSKGCVRAAAPRARQLQALFP